MKTQKISHSEEYHRLVREAAQACINWVHHATRYGENAVTTCVRHDLMLGAIQNLHNAGLLLPDGGFVSAKLAYTFETYMRDGKYHAF